MQIPLKATQIHGAYLIQISIIFLQNREKQMCVRKKMKIISKVAALIAYVHPLCSIENTEFTIDQQYLPLVQSVWATSSPPWHNYYSMTINGQFFPGGRPLAARWNLLRDALDWNGKKIIELGCNTAIMSILLKKYYRPQTICCVDCEDSYIRVANILTKAFAVEARLVVANLDCDNYEQLLGTDYDVAICMSLLFWIKDKERLLLYLSNFKFVIYEGHDEDELETARFRAIGFDCLKTLGRPDLKKRTLMLFGRRELCS